MNDLAILRMADAMARHASGRHELISRNIANADTPGFRARDLKPFEALLPSDFDMRATRPTHLNAEPTQNFEPVFTSAPGSASPNGNDVALPDQMMRATGATQSHDMAMTVYKKTMDILRLGLGR